MLHRIYIATGIGILGFYSLSAFNGWEFATPPRENLPADVRSSPGGYRAFHFWHSGYRGGK
jgi:hypothetical protein